MKFCDIEKVCQDKDFVNGYRWCKIVSEPCHDLICPKLEALK